MNAKTLTQSTHFQSTTVRPAMQRTLMMSMIALSMGGMSVAAQAQTQQQKEIEQLRQEVQALRGLIEQQKVQNAQTATAIANVQRTAAAPVANPVLKTAKGAEFNLYGNVRLDASYQVEGGARDMPYNQINGVALEGNAENSDRFRSTLAATRLGLDFKTQVGAEDVKGKLEVDFLGGNLDSLRIRHAYLTYADWLIGQTWSNFAVPDYMPETVDALAYAGGAVKRTPQVRYTAKFSPQTNLVVAAEDPKDNSITQRLPALTARLNHQFADNLNVSVRAMGHEKRVNSDEEMAWGVGVGAKYDIVPGTTLKADYYHVKGDSSFVSFANKGVAVTALDKEKGTITADSRIAAQSEFDSIMVGITQKFGDKVHGTLGYGYMNFDKDPNYIAATSDKTTINKDLWQAWANVFYSPIKPVSLGLEYVYGEREAVVPAANGNKKGEDNRINMVAIYNF